MIIPWSASLAGAWDRYCNAHPLAWFWHRSGWMEYCSHHGDLMNMSFAVVLDDGSVAGLCPIILDGNDLTYQNGPCPEPLYDNDSVRYELLRHLRAIIDSYLVTSYEFREQIEGLQADDISWQTQVIQLLPRNETERWREVRRSYKSIIHTAQRTHRIERSCDPSAVEILHGLHRDQAGRETRDQYTWDLMASWVASGHAYLCLAWNDAGVCDGAIYVYVYTSITVTLPHQRLELIMHWSGRPFAGVTARHSRWVGRDTHRTRRAKTSNFSGAGLVDLRNW